MAIKRWHEGIQGSIAVYELEIAGSHSAGCVGEDIAEILRIQLWNVRTLAAY